MPTENPISSPINHVYLFDNYWSADLIQDEIEALDLAGLPLSTFLNPINNKGLNYTCWSHDNVEDFLYDPAHNGYLPGSFILGHFTSKQVSTIKKSGGKIPIDQLVIFLTTQQKFYPAISNWEKQNRDDNLYRNDENNTIQALKFARRGVLHSTDPGHAIDEILHYGKQGANTWSMPDGCLSSDYPALLLPENFDISRELKISLCQRLFNQSFIEPEKEPKLKDFEKKKLVEIKGIDCQQVQQLIEVPNGDKLRTRVLDLSSLLFRGGQHVDASGKEDHEVVPQKNNICLLNPGSFADSLQEHFRQSVFKESCEVISSFEQLSSFAKSVHLFDHRSQKLQLIILVELTWGGLPYSSFWGYDIAESIILKGFRGKICFFSSMDRATLSRENEPRQHFAKIFQHVPLPSTNTAFSAIKVPPISERKWQFISDYALQNGGIIDYLLHELNYYRERIDEVEIFANKVLAYSTMLGKQSKDYATSLKSNSFQGKDDASIILEKLYRALKDETLRYRNEEAVAARSNHRLLIVEDKKHIRDALCKGFKQYFKEVYACGDGEEAQGILLNSAESYSAVVMDMELLDEHGFWQDVQGIDLLEMALMRPHLSLMVLSVISKMARTKVDLLQRVKVVPKEENGTYLPFYENYKSLSDELIREADQRAKYKDGPNSGPWIKKGLLSYYFQLRREQPDEFAKVWEEADKQASTFIKGNNTNWVYKFHNNTRPADSYHNTPYLTRVLSHRLVCIYIQKERSTVERIDYIDVCKLLEKMGATVPRDVDRVGNKVRQFLNTNLGLSQGQAEQSPLPQHRKINLELNILLPEEVSWLEKKTRSNPLMSTYNIRDEFEPLYSTLITSSLDIGSLGDKDYHRSWAEFEKFLLLTYDIVHDPSRRPRLASYFIGDLQAASDSIRSAAFDEELEFITTHFSTRAEKALKEFPFWLSGLDPS